MFRFRNSPETLKTSGLNLVITEMSSYFIEIGEQGVKGTSSHSTFQTGGIIRKGLLLSKGGCHQPTDKVLKQKNVQV